MTVVLTKVADQLHRDWLAMLLFAAATAIMTYPIITEISTIIPSAGSDIFTAFWQKYWLVTAVQEGHNPNFTPYLFHPTGLDITFQPRRWAAFGSWIPLTALFGDVTGYNLNVLIGLWLSAYTTYLLILYLTGDRMAAWIGGGLLAFYPQHVNRGLGQPNTGSIQLMPLVILLMLATFDRLENHWQGSEKRSYLSTVKVLLPGLLMLSWNAYISIKVWILITITLALLTSLLALARNWWRLPLFWRDMAFLTMAGLILVLPVTLPFLTSDNLTSAIEVFEPGPGIDVLATFISSPGYPPFVTPLIADQFGLPDKQWINGTAYVGVISMILVIIGLVKTNNGRRYHKWTWFGLAVLIWSLSLGTTLRINGETYEHLWTPYNLIKDISLFQAFRQPKRLALAFILPWAVLTGYGAAWLRQRIQRPVIAQVVIAALAVLLLYEINEIPLKHRSVPDSGFYDFLREEARPGALIDLPMGRQETKAYMMAQTMHGRPLVEGVVARMPDGAYDYITANPLLEDWQEVQEPKCEEYDMAQAVAALQEDGFIYVVLHKGNEELMSYFQNTPTTYHDDRITAYSLADFSATLPCP